MTERDFERVREMAAIEGDKIGDEAWDAYKHGRERGNPHFQGISDGAHQVARAIRSLTYSQFLKENATAQATASADGSVTSEPSGPAAVAPVAELAKRVKSRWIELHAKDPVSGGEIDDYVEWSSKRAAEMAFAILNGNMKEWWAEAHALHKLNNGPATDAAELPAGRRETGTIASQNGVPEQRTVTAVSSEPTPPSPPSSGALLTEEENAVLRLATYIVDTHTMAPWHGDNLRILSREVIRLHAQLPTRAPSGLAKRLRDIVEAYDAYRGRGVMPAPDQYQQVVSAIEAARAILCALDAEQGAKEGR